MPRRGILRELAREHHGSLLLARDIARLGDEVAADALAAMNARIATYWRTEMAAHFRREEALLLRHAGVLADAHVIRLLDDHCALAALCVRAGESDLGIASLQAFGQRLHDHVRFEERACFDALQAAEEAVVAPDE